MIRPLVRRGALLAAPLLLAILALRATGLDALPKESWTGIYFNGKKIGYSDLRTESSTFAGQSAIKLTSHSVTNIELLGTKVSQDVSFTLFTDKTYAPIHQEYQISSNGSSMSLVADYKPGKILCKIDAGGGSTDREIPVPAGAKLTGDSTVINGGNAVPVGHKEIYYYLNPVTVALDRLDVEVRAKDRVTLSGAGYNALRIIATTPLGSMTSWETQEGEMLKGEMSMGPLSITMFRESREAAMRTSGAPPAFAIASSSTAPGAAARKNTPYTPSDVALATAVRVDRDIPDPRHVKSLTVEVSGISDKAHFFSDARQTTEPVSDKPDVYRVKIVAAPFDAPASALLPIVSAETKPYQARAAYLETDDPQIQGEAKGLRGNDTNAYKVAVAIHDWVHATMKPDYSIGVPRSCVTLYKDPRGVCRDYATLFAGVARAAGIPTRLVGGIVYAEGKFFYHAWDECWVGRWTALDPTMPGDFVDATHIKFAQGDVTEMYQIAGVVGKIKLKVLDVQ